MISVGSEVQILPGPFFSDQPSAFTRQTTGAGMQASGRLSDGCRLTADAWRGLSSAGRAPALQAGGHRFDPDSLHHSCPARMVLRLVEVVTWLVLWRSSEFGHHWPAPESVGLAGRAVRSSSTVLRALRPGAEWVERCWSFNRKSGSGASLGVPLSASLTGCPCA